MKIIEIEELSVETKRNGPSMIIIRGSDTTLGTGLEIADLEIVTIDKDELS